jgi:hypothetical protein
MASGAPMMMWIDDYVSDAQMTRMGVLEAEPASTPSRSTIIRASRPTTSVES